MAGESRHRTHLIITGKQRTALITGASAGLGVSFAKQLAERGYDLVLTARRRERLEALATEIRDECGREARVIVADLADPSAPDAIYRELTDDGVTIDYLVNNAGVAGPFLLRDSDWSAHRSFQQLMMTSVAHFCHLFIPPMIERGFGRVINVASVAGLIASPSGRNYSPAKRYVIALSEELSLTVTRHGVNVCALCPGCTHTEFHEAPDLKAMKQSIPSFMWYTADRVVKDGLDAVEKGKAIAITGTFYRWLAPLIRSRFAAWVMRRESLRSPD